MTDFNTLNAHSRDSRLAFNAADHSYTAVLDDGSRLLCDSVTQLVDSLFPQFDADYWAERKATATITADMLKAQWAARGEAARRLGTEMHERIENYYLGHAADAAAMADGAFRKFMDFAAVYHLKPYRSEWRIFSEKYRLAGTLDFLEYAEGRFTIYDWKRSLKVVDATGAPIRLNSYGEHAFAPVEHIHDTAFNHYALQLSLYRYILSTEYGIEASACRLGVFHPELSRFAMVELPYLRDEVMAILRRRL